MSTPPSPNVATISPARPFLEVLATALLEDTTGRPEDLARTTILLPTRRAVRSLQGAFLNASNGAPLILPRLLALNDLDEDEASISSLEAGLALDIPPPIDPLRRQLMLARMIGALDTRLPPDQTLRLASELASLIDQVQTEQLTFDALDKLVPEDLATHWAEILDFLKVITHSWPDILTEDGAIDPAQHRNLVFTSLADAWRRSPPDGPVIAAGSTGSIPATANLLDVIAHLPEGLVILPGLDHIMSEADWQALDPPHPQFGLRALLNRLGVSRDNVPEWRAHILPPRDHLRDRLGLLSTAMTPSDADTAWRELPKINPAALQDVSLLEVANEETEARAIALHLRAAMEVPGQTAALVTPDRALARRVAGELARWGILVDDSAGRPLSVTPPGVFLRLLAQAACDGFTPVSLLALLKHPLCGAGYGLGSLRRIVRDLDRAENLLRGPRPPTTLAALCTHARELDRPPPPSVLEFLDRLAELTASLERLSQARAPCDFASLFETFLRTAEDLAATSDTPGPLRLWSDEAGEAAASLCADLSRQADLLPPLHTADLPSVLAALMAARPVRRQSGQHPRLAIWGPLEARLQRPDVMVLGGLSEGVWPRDPSADPWMSRPMRMRFGLPLPERRIGLSAHDFVQALGGPKVVMTRSDKVAGSPVIAARWIMRLRAVALAAGLLFDDPDYVSLPASSLEHWALSLDRPAGGVRPAEPPAPRPPKAARPTRLPVTAVEMWMRDPYAFYARHILRLKSLPDLEAAADAAEYGILIHEVMEKFIAAHPQQLSETAHSDLVSLGDELFARRSIDPAVRAFWEPRFARTARWVIAQETLRRARLQRAAVEVTGEYTLPDTDPPFTVTAKADRIDHMADGTLEILDYKTGTVPKKKAVHAGFKPQLPLEGVIAQAGGFDNLPAADVIALLYWKLGTKGTGGDESAACDDIAGVIDQAERGLRARVAVYTDPATPYRAQADQGQGGLGYPDYAHLARVQEWAEGGGTADSNGDDGS